MAPLGSRASIQAVMSVMKAHGNQKRASGAPYFSHPLEVAAILAEMRLDDATIATALLHDTIEDTETTRSEIDAMDEARAALRHSDTEARASGT